MSIHELSKQSATPATTPTGDYMYLYFKSDGNLYGKDSTGTETQLSGGAGGVPTTRDMIAGAGLTGGGDLSADRTFNVIANVDGSIVVNADDVQVGVLASDAQHGVRGGGTQHAAATTGANGFMSAADKTKIDALPSSAPPETRDIIAGAGLTGGGDLSADRTLNAVGNADASIVVNADDIQVGVLATDGQHGTRGGGTQHAAATTSVNGFMSAADKTKLDGVATGATDDTTADAAVVAAAAAQATADAAIPAIVSTDNVVPRFDGTGGDVQSSGISIADDDRVLGVATPTGDTDAANKAYVDDAVRKVKFSGYVSYTNASTYWRPNDAFGFDYPIWNSNAGGLSPGTLAKGVPFNANVTLVGCRMIYDVSQTDATNQAVIRLMRHRKTLGGTGVANLALMSDLSLTHTLANASYGVDFTLTATALDADDMVIPIVSGSGVTTTNIAMTFVLEYRLA